MTNPPGSSGPYGGEGAILERMAGRTHPSRTKNPAAKSKPGKTKGKTPYSLMTFRSWALMETLC